MTRTNLNSKGPYTAHAAITCAIVKGPDEFMQTTETLLGAKRLAELLNHVDYVVNSHGFEITPNTRVDVKEIVAAAVARACGWRLELPLDRKARLET